MKERKSAKRIKGISVLLVVIAMMLATPVTLSAAECSAPVGNTAQSAEEAEETEYYFMKADGIWWYRLWSLTNGKWLTDWLPL